VGAWRDGTLFIILSIISTSRLEDFSENSFGIRSKLLQQPRICGSDLLDQRLSHRGILSDNLAHILQLSRRKLGHSSSSATKSATRSLLPLLLLLLGKLEEIGGSGLLDGLLSRGWIGGRLLRLGLGGLLGGWWWGQLGLDMSGDALVQNVISCHPCMGQR